MEVKYLKFIKRMSKVKLFWCSTFECRNSKWYECRMSNCLTIDIQMLNVKMIRMSSIKLFWCSTFECRTSNCFDVQHSNVEHQTVLTFDIRMFWLFWLLTFKCQMSNCFDLCHLTCQTNFSPVRRVLLFVL